MDVRCKIFIAAQYTAVDGGKQGIETVTRIATSLKLLFVLGLVLVASPVSAQADFRLGLPVACELGDSCWVVNLVDLDPGPAVKDYLCQAQTYDGHKGTDIAIRDLKAMQKGVRVVASAAGVVRGIRDGMADQDFSVDGGKAVAGRECGNGVVIAHGDGWETQYCHLRRGSVGVSKGSRVKKGQYLGLVGHSGKAAFPHVHLSVRHQNLVVDPFVGQKPAVACGLADGHLWDHGLIDALSQPLTSIFNAGFAAVAPKTQAILEDHYQDKGFLRNAPALVLWAAIYNIQKGDRVVMRITDPDGGVLHAYENVIDKTQARRILYSGKKRTTLYWPDGTYQGEIAIHRKSPGGVDQVIEARREILMH